MLNIVFRSFHYDLLGAYNLQLRFILLFKEIEVHSHLPNGRLFFNMQRLVKYDFFICSLNWQQISNGKMCVVKVKGTPTPSLSNYHQGAFEQHRSKLLCGRRGLVVLVQERKLT